MGPDTSVSSARLHHGPVSGGRGCSWHPGGCVVGRDEGISHEPLASPLSSADHTMLQEVGPEVMSTAPVLGVGEASLGVDQGLATFLMVLVACSLDHQVTLTL